MFGRYVNGVPRENVCFQAADPQNAVGEFIHIEQAAVSRHSDAYAGWAAAINATFGTGTEIGQ